MRTRSLLVLGGGVVSAATVGAVLVGTIGTTATLVLTDPTAPKASADSLTRFDSCPALRDWFVEHGTAEVGPYGWNGPRVYLTSLDAVPGAAPAAQGSVSAGAPESAAISTDARSSSNTGTNTQEADVDEPDIAKTDGRLVVRLVDQRVVVVSDVTGAEPRELGRISLPIDAYGGELLLAGDHVLVSQAGGTWRGPMPGGPIQGGPIQGAPVPDAPVPGDPRMVAPEVAAGKLVAPGGGTRIIDVGLSDPAHPRILHDDSYTGSLVSMRLYGDTVRLVTSTPRPELPWVTPGRPGKDQLSEAEAVQRNRALVRSTTIGDWLPAVVDNLSHSRTRLVDCADVYHPADWSGGETTTVTTYDVGDPGRRTSVAVTADGQVVYSSASRLYVTSVRVDPPGPWGGTNGSVSGAVPQPYRVTQVSTQLHAFALDGTTTRYVGSGHVTGSVRDRWSLDEHGGSLRVAWTRTDPHGRTQNGVTVLAERDGALVPTGTIERLGVDETIQSVRWFDDFAVLVTFRQTDPLYTIDLTDPAHPREIGQLKIPGYSGYLHPIGDHLLLGLGMDATPTGRGVGAQAAVFDIHDLADPRRLSQQGFGPSSLPALGDPRGFTWLPDRRTGITSVESWSDGRRRLVAMHVAADGILEARDLATDVGWNTRTLPLADGRVAVVDQGLRVLDPG